MNFIVLNLQQHFSQALFLGILIYCKMWRSAIEHLGIINYVLFDGRGSYQCINVNLVCCVALIVDTICGIEGCVV